MWWTFEAPVLINSTGHSSCNSNLSALRMRPLCSLLRISRCGSRTRVSPSVIKSVRHSSLDALQTSLHQELTSRPKNYIFDYLTPTPSHLLNITLSDFLPDSCQPYSFSKQNLELPTAYSHCSDTLPLPQGHHIVYFPPQVPSSCLLPDGTDYLQSPGSPFDRRMWAGGSLHFDPQLSNQLLLSNSRVYCTESMPSVVVRGTDGDEKIFVTIKREVGRNLSRTEVSNAKCKISNSSEQLGDGYLLPPSIVEERNLVYFRTKTPAAMKKDSERPAKILKRKLLPVSHHFFVFSVLMLPSCSDT